ncbi:pseudouridine synthase [Sulfuriflexus mobilis]|uniref:pseudouridine synthase n=1 Tax=Sulfuriflexus mobilis TaxID=1811807 RepID=UPI001E512AD9|nr:pseudouridine synthase [Sulfuriflexus mobilis]
MDKPSGLLSVPGRGEDKQDCLISRAQIEFPELLIVHRLDMSTSGIIIMAFDKDTQRLLSDLFAQREVLKHYTAVVAGKLEHPVGLIDKPMICDWPNRPRQIIDFEKGKPAQTHYETIEYMPEHNTTRLMLTPVTGRTHQLRLHCQSIGHAILGDRLYASPEAMAGAERLLLHATSLSFAHPISGESILIESAPPF